MPISPAYSWTETDTIITVTAQCRGAETKKLDSFSSPHYVSVNAPPYFLELDLHTAIDSTRSVASVRQGAVVLKLFKAEEAKWGRLLVDLPRDERLKRRDASRALASEEAQAALERKKRIKWDDSRFTLGKQMDKDRGERARIDGYKEAEKNAGASELERFAEESEATSAVRLKYDTPVQSTAAYFDTKKKVPFQFKSSKEEGKASLAERDKALKAKMRSAATDDEVTDDCGIVEIGDEDAPPMLTPEEAKRAQLQQSKIFDDDDGDDDYPTAAKPVVPPKQPPKQLTKAEKAKAEAEAKAAAAKAVAEKAKAAAKAAAEAKARALPPPRSAKKVTIGFTKQMLTAPARTKTSNADYDLPLDPLTAPEIFKGNVEGDISQRDPAWLKDRGDRYYRMGDWRSAEEAYSMVLAQFAKSIMGQAIDCVTACYSNRAACRIQLKRYIEAATDCGQALGIMSKARCVTEYPKSEAAHVRCRMRLLSRRGAAYARAGVLHRALTDLKVASGLADGPLPSDAADRQMLASDSQRVADRHDEVVSLLEKADKLLAEAQPAAQRAAAAKRERAEARGHTAIVADGDAADDDLLESSARSTLEEARALYDEAVLKAPLEVSALANRAACVLFLGEPTACVNDCTAALMELECEEIRADEKKAEHVGMFAAPLPPKELTALTEQLAKRTPTLRFELLTRRGSAHVDAGEDHYPRAASDFKAALKLRPAEPSVVRALDQLSKRAAEAGVELEVLPPMIQQGGLELDAEDDDDDDEEEGKEEEEEAEEAAAGDAVAAGEGTMVAAGAAGGSAAASKPAVGTRTAAQLKADADNAFREARLGKAVTLYGKALKADASAEWLGGGGGILFRCQCLANRSACHLKLSAFIETVNDAGAAIAALSTGLVSSDMKTDADALLLKLLARRGMALCQLSRYEEAASDYGKAVELDPDNEQLKNDLKIIEQHCKAE